MFEITVGIEIIRGDAAFFDIVFHQVAQCRFGISVSVVIVVADIRALAVACGEFCDECAVHAEYNWCYRCISVTPAHDGFQCLDDMFDVFGRHLAVACGEFCDECAVHAEYNWCYRCISVTPAHDGFQCLDDMFDVFGRQGFRQCDANHPALMGQ